MIWCDKWNTINVKDRLTKETFKALHHTTTALLEISEYCFEELNANYVLLGKFQTNCLEARFGKYRQLAEGQHNVSLRQIYECKKQIRLLAVLKLKVSGKDFNLTRFELELADFSSDSSFAVKNLSIQLLREERKSAIE